MPLKSFQKRLTLHVCRFTSSLERARGFEPLTTCLGSKDSTTELRPLTEPNPTLGLYTKSRNARLRDSFDDGKLPAPNLEPILSTGKDSQHSVRIALFLTIHFNAALNDEPPRFAFAGD